MGKSLEVVDKGSNQIKFNDLDLGQVFRYNGKLYVVIEATTNNENALDFTEYECWTFGGNQEVIPVNAKLEIF